ncbi:uncharacterized protein PGTG_18460 [Puccinia graminis f. sp. tritici CRL 75-36-700-3]|uniref:Uncharacterized protein n=1 Tax=Puccinia graminis f. sp. tritici (strain CRL 75-36-700-3 / race SCCL) TaxID=418459 RepID=E3L6S0_PUCGT|nr:uncharacterized protein PGTG_18460 [Puccinia graminis f. sp. tritici CRL 75-36-700-3]EFP92245.1 hypothetical protein PGTG_18460 [Puccinia graminis f. sp. tritici CRL 75-36-700-3]
MLKTDRNTLRGCLLENIKTSSIHKEIKGPVPNLTKLISHIIKAFFPKEQAFLGASFDPAHVPQSRTRIAYLRLETIRYVFGTEKTNSAQWDLIDPQLEFIRGQSMDYYRAWSELIIQKDDELFGTGQQEFEKLDEEESFLPTHEDVLELQAEHQRDREQHNRHS